MLGSFMAQWVWVAVPGMFLLALGGSLLASKSLFGMVVLNLCVPLAGVGLSYNGLNNSIHVGLLLIIGSIVAYAWSLCFKEYQRPPARAEIALMNSIQARNYGIRLGSTAAIATAIGFALGIEHIGWIVGAGLCHAAFPRHTRISQQMAYSISVYWCNGCILATNPKSAATNDWRSCWRSARNNICHTFESMVYYTSLLNVLSFLDTLVQRTDSCKYRASFQRTSARDHDRCRIGVPNWCYGPKISNTPQVRITNVPS